MLPYSRPFVLGLFVLSLFACHVSPQGLPAPPVPQEPVLQCATTCCGPEPPIPSTFKLFVADFSPFAFGVARVISREEAVASLDRPYLRSEQIIQLAGRSESFFTAPLIPSIAESIVFPNLCEIPIDLACSFRFCGCQVGSGRRLTQCFPFFRPCGAFGAAASQVPPQVGPDGTVIIVDRGPPEGVQLVVGICVDIQCTLFAIRDGSDVEIEEGASQVCPARRDAPAINQGPGGQTNFPNFPSLDSGTVQDIFQQFKKQSGQANG